MSSFITKTVQIAFTILLVLILFAFAVSIGGMVAGGMAGIVVTAGLLFLCALMVCFGGKILGFLRTKVVPPINKLSTRQMVLIIGTVTFLTKLFFIFLLDVDSTLHSDMQMYHSFANQLAANGQITEYVKYASKHTYTAIYGLILSPFAKLFGSDPKVLTIVLTAGMSVASILLFDILRKRTGKAIAFCGILLYNLLPMGLFQTQLLVHETALLCFSIPSLWLLLKSFDKDRHTALRVICILLSGVCIAVGLSVNAAGKVILISLCIISVVKIIGEKITLKKLLSAVCFFLIFAIAVVGISGILTSTIKNLIDTENAPTFNTENRLPYGWSIYLGLNYEYSGVINKEDADTYHKYEGFDDPEEAKQYQKDLIHGRLEEYISNPGRIPVHLFKKTQALWGGLWLPFPYAQGNAVEHFILTGVGGLLYKGMYMFNALIYLFVLSMILFSMRIKGKWGCDDEANLHCKMVIIGVTVVLLCFEVCFKYASHLQILMYGIWMLQLKDFAVNSGAIQQKLSSKLKKHPK